MPEFRAGRDRRPGACQAPIPFRFRPQAGGASRMSSVLSVASGVQIAARPRVFCSSRTFPGHGCARRRFLAPEESFFSTKPGCSGLPGSRGQGGDRSGGGDRRAGPGAGEGAAPPLRGGGRGPRERRRRPPRTGESGWWRRSSARPPCGCAKFRPGEPHLPGAPAAVSPAPAWEARPPRRGKGSPRTRSTKWPLRSLAAPVKAPFT